MKKQIAIIGNFNLVAECIKILEAQNFNIVCLFSEIYSVQEWAKNRNVLLAKDLNSFFDMIRQTNIDYLFNIQNSFIIPESVLENINELAIHYHEGLFSECENTNNNASWAIWFKEKESGITWYTVNRPADKINILKQKKFLLDENETAFSLKLKCQESAKQTLKELVIELQSGEIQNKTQSLSSLPNFYAFSRPCGAAIIDWNNKAENIERQFRALNFCPQPNSLITLKFKYKDKYFSVLTLRILKNKSIGIAAGTVIDIKDGLLQIATQSYDLLVGYKGLHCHASASEISKGEILGNENSSLEEQKYVVESIAQDEPYWRKVLSHFSPGRNFIQNKVLNFSSYSPLFKIQFNELFSGHLEYNSEDVLTLLLGYLYRINNYEDFSLCVSGRTIHLPEKLSRRLFLEIKPLNISLNNQNFAETKNTIKQLLSDNESKNVFFRDLLIRYPDFEKILVRNTILLNISSKIPVKENIHPIIIDLDEENQSLSLLIADAFSEKMPYFLNFMLDHLQNLARSWAISDAPLNTINFLSCKEMNYLKSWNNTQVDFNSNRCISAIIEDVCKRFPQNIAIETKDRSISYEELKKYSEQIAKNILYYINNQKITNTLVGIFLDKSVNTILTFLGVLKAGLTYVVLDTTYPDTYLENIIESTQTQIFISQSEKYNRLYKIIHAMEDYKKPLYLELDETLLKEKHELQLPENIPTTTLAYVLFTSGSTGKPKGVMISQQSVINLVNAVNASTGINDKDKLLQFSTLAFDTSVWEIYASLFAGSTLYIPEPSETRIGKNLQNTIVSKNISFSIFPPSVLRVQPYFESATLKTIIVGGEECYPILPKQWGNYYRFINVYGPTEATVIATMSKELKPNDEVTIGRPIQNYQITICDRYQIELPIGVIGEIIISGNGIAQGYINNPELTQQKFKTLSPLDPQKIGYLSGDLGKWNKEGAIEYVGRIDSQLKIRGFRVEPAMIEQVANTYAGVNTCIVLANKTEKDRLFLSAYILPDENSIAPDLNSLKDFLKARLPHFMIPKKFFLVQSLPLTAVGKIDRAKLLAHLNPDFENLSEEVSLLL